MLDLRMTHSIEKVNNLNAPAFEAFQQRFRGDLIRPGEREYDQARHVWNGMIDKYPALIARCRGTEDVISAVNFAREHNLLVAVRGGGHNAAGTATCDGGLVIDLSTMRAVAVDPAQRTVRAQGGATWADVDQATQAHGLATPGGAVSTTGIAGLTLGGGLGWLRRKYGLSCDNLVAVDVVTADGHFVKASPDENADLFWAIQGGGGNFGVVTNFEYQLHPVGPEVFFLLIFYPVKQAKTLLVQWRDFMRTAPDEFSSNAFFWTVPPAPFIPAEAHGRRVLVMAGMYAGSIDEGERVVQSLRSLTTPVTDLTGPMPYVAVQSSLDALFPAGQLHHYLDAFSQGETALPPQGARFDFSFAGRISGEKINGSIRGVDYGIVRADGRFDLDLQAQIITDDGEKIAFYADGIFTPPDPVTGIGQVRENVRLITASPRYAWVNKLQIWATGGSNVTTGQIRLKGYIA